MDKIQILQGDCYELIPAIESVGVDAIITDPPYGTTNLEWDHKIDLVKR
jgi:site-specific DNA-methyltransferase (adenine-specific)